MLWEDASARSNAGFEPSTQANEYKGLHKKSSIGTEIGTTRAVASEHLQSCPVTEVLSADIQKIIEAWPTLDALLKDVVMAVVRAQGR